MFNPSRDEARRFLIDAWKKRRDGSPLSALESIAAGIVSRHPEYHPLLEAPDGSVEREFPPEGGNVNPFLHLSLHLAVEEQIAIDQPPGIRGQYERLLLARGDGHSAQHAVLECLAETVWAAQRHGTPPDAALYLSCLERQR
jgi:hypothetical protein